MTPIRALSDGVARYAMSFDDGPLGIDFQWCPEVDDALAPRIV